VTNTINFWKRLFHLCPLRGGSAILSTGWWPGLPGRMRQQGCVASVSGINLPIGTSAKPLVQPPFVGDAPAGGRSGHPDGTGTAGAPGREDDDDLHARAGSPGPRADQPAGSDAGSRVGRSRGCSEARRWRERADVDLNRAVQALMRGGLASVSLASGAFCGGVFCGSSEIQVGRHSFQRE
jgi:hypothetical protein